MLYLALVAPSSERHCQSKISDMVGHLVVNLDIKLNDFLYPTEDKRQKEIGKNYQEQLQKKLIEDGKKAHEQGIQQQLQRQEELRNQHEEYLSHHR